MHLLYARPGFEPWVGKAPGEGKGLPTQVFWLGEFHGLHSPQGCKELDMTEQFSLSFNLLACEMSATV